MESKFKKDECHNDIHQTEGAYMSDAEMKLVEKAKREAAVSLIGALAKAMGATVLYYNPDVGEFALKMDPRAVDFFGTESLVTALGDVT